MKTVAFEHFPGQTIVLPPRVDLIADSALVMPGKPLFLPDFTDNWSAMLYVAYRVSRLGKSITPKFAPRYYDAVTLALRLIPAHMLELLKQGYLPTGIGGAFDNCVALGKWLPLPADESTPMTIGAPQLELDTSLTLKQTGIDEALAALSTYGTLKTGDIIMPCRLPLALTPTIGTDLTATFMGTTVLSLHIR